MGEERDTTFFRDLVATNGLITQVGHPLLVNLVAWSEVPLALTVCQYSPEQLKKKGAPIDWFAIEPAVAISDTMAVMKKAPHRHAALLFYDYLLTEEGNRLIARFGYAPTCRQLLNTPLGKMRVKLLNLNLQHCPTNRPNPVHHSTQSLPNVAASS